MVAAELYDRMGSSVALFSRLSEDLRHKICIAMKHTVAMHRDKIIVEGTMGDCMYVIESGEVDVILTNTTPGGPPTKLGRLGQHGFFGELAVLGDRPMAYLRTVRARHFCKLATLSKVVLDGLRDVHPELDSHLLSFQTKNVAHGRQARDPVLERVMKLEAMVTEQHGMIADIHKTLKSLVKTKKQTLPEKPAWDASWRKGEWDAMTSPLTSDMMRSQDSDATER